MTSTTRGARNAATPSPGTGEAKARAAQPAGSPSSDERLDTVGFFCPIPIIKTAARVRTMQLGKVLEVIADDRVILVDLPNWCRGAGQEYLGHREDSGELHLFLRKTRDGAPPRQRGIAPSS